MRVLFLHQNFPGQFRHLAPALAAAGHEVHALAITPRARLEGVRLHRYALGRGSTPGVHALASEFETKVIRGEACARALVALRARGFEPDLVVAHPGWGEALFVKDVFPATRMLAFLEYHYGGADADTGFDPEFPADALHAAMRQRVKNANNLLAYDAMDWGLSPTGWQRSRIPRIWQDRVSVVFDGIDTELVRPDPGAGFSFQAADGAVHTLQAGDEVITFVNRNLEPYRGYHVFMRALPEILRRRPGARVLVVGEDGVSYGSRPPDGRSWKQRFFEEVAGELDLGRVFFLGRLEYADYLKLLQVSACHVYLTYPFVLSWSCVEAMSAGCLVVGSDTGPVREAIEHGRNGLLVDFFDRGGLVDAVERALAEPLSMRPLRAAARADAVARYDLRSVCLPRQLELVDAVASGRLPGSAPSAGGDRAAGQPGARP